jgi:2,4'-dihydroxyacetophenone dioxygenase
LEGNTKEVRYPGTYTAGVANDEPHTEGGGQEDVVVLFSLRPYSSDKPIYEILDETGEIAAIMTFNALKELHEVAVEAPE